ncbi:unnamed protein product [Owenia fusiformis]|uniref:Uncharacterized protein n=1 Tax=Owenia fusiformis TaxID=6347 RepID=A0A8J1Y680_OWEFU|nr:unnamed protein product [Owenia fusiformis]
MDVDALRSAQHHCETLFQCPVCWLPKLEMVYGTCQHRVCVDCVYRAGVLRSEFSKCPTCNQKFPFPLYRPIIPDDNIEVQKKLGITRCQNSTSCKTEMWLWEIEEHNKVCKFKKPKKSRSESQTQSPEL